MKKTSISFGMIVVVAALAGCASPSAVEQNFGASVREMQTNQRYLPPDAVIRPQGHRPLDPGKAGAILETYRGDVAKPEEVADDIRIRMRTY